MAEDVKGTPSEREAEYDALIQKLLDNGYQNTPYSLLHNIYPFANESKYIGIYQDEQNDTQYPLIDNETRDLEYSKDNSETIASEINKMVISTNLTSATSNAGKMRLRSVSPKEKAKSLVSNSNSQDKELLLKLVDYLNYSPQATSNSGSSLPACARADRLGTTWFSIGALLGRTRDEGLCASWNRYLNYTSSAVVKDIHDVLWKSKIENNKGKNPTKDPNRESWNRGIVNSELYNQRFNIWAVNMTEGSPTIKLTSYGDFKHYKFTEQQLVNGLEISFLPTQAGSGYSAGSSYTINIDGIEKKLFEDIDETVQGTGSSIVANQMLKIYYNSSADSGNGAFFILKTGGEEAGGGDKKVGDVFWSDHIIDYEEGETPRALIMNGQEVNLSLYPDFSDYLKTLKVKHPDQFVDNKKDWDNIEASSVFHSSTRLGQVNKYLLSKGNLYAYTDAKTNSTYYTTEETLAEGQKNIYVYDEKLNYLGVAEYAGGNLLFSDYNQYFKESTAGGLTITLKDDNSGYKITGFSSNKSLYSTEQKLDPNRPFVAQLKIDYTTNAGSFWMGVNNASKASQDAGGILFTANGTSNNIAIGFSSTGTGENIKFGSVVPSPKTGNVYYVRAMYDGVNTYSYAYSTDKTTWTTTWSGTSDLKLFKSDNCYIILGCCERTGGGHYSATPIYIDEDTYIKYTDTNEYLLHFSYATRDTAKDKTINNICKLKCIYDTTGLTATGEEGTIQSQELPNTTTGGTFSNNKGSYAGYVRQEAVRGYYYVQVMSEKQEELRTFHYCGSVNDETSLPSDADDGDIYCLSDTQELRCYSEKLGSWQYYPKPNFQANTRQVGEVFTSDHQLSSITGDVHVLDGSTIDISTNKWMLNYITALKISNPEQFASTLAGKTDEQFYYNETTKQLTLKKLVIREIVEDTIDNSGNGYVLYSDGWIEQKFSYNYGSATNPYHRTPLTFYKPFKDTNYDIVNYAVRNNTVEGTTPSTAGNWGISGKQKDKILDVYWFPHSTSNDYAQYFTWIISGYIEGTTSTPSLKYIQLKPLTLDWSKTFNFKSAVNTYADLPATATNGDVYYVSTEDTTNKKGNYVFGDNNTWYFIGDEKYFVENPFSYGFLMRSKTNMINNPCWLKSDGVVKEGTTYNGFYQYLLDIWNNGTATTYTDTKGNTYSGKLKNGIIVIDYSDWGSIYSSQGIVNAFGINTSSSQFYLPYGEESKRVLIEKKEPTADDTNWYNLYSDGWCEQGIIVDAGSDVSLKDYEWTYLKEFRDTNYSVQACATNSTTNYYASVLLQHGGKHTNKIDHIGWFSSESKVRYGHYEVRGYVATTEIANINYYDYYYVGNVIQNQSAINVANLLAELEAIKSSVVRIVKSDYTSDVKYEVYNNGMCRQWGHQTYQSGAKYDVVFTYAYTDTSYNVNTQTYYNKSAASSSYSVNSIILDGLKTTTGMTINSSSTASGLGIDWMTYGKIDLTTI